MTATGYGDAPARVGFFTDTTVCIGCKACEVACKEWNAIPSEPFAWMATSYDNHADGLGADTWRHVAFIEQRLPEITREAEAGAFAEGGEGLDLTRVGADGFAAEIPSSGDVRGEGAPSGAPGGGDLRGEGAPSGAPGGGDLRGEGAPSGAPGGGDLRWLMSSDVCKHCTSAACLDVCPTGALFKTEFTTVVVQPDICNGCGYCVPACPYGVIDRREDDGRAWKCTLCYDRLKDGEEPACAKACPTDSINFGTLEAMEAMARDRLDQVVAADRPGARLYGTADGDGEGVDGAGALFLLLDEPEVYGLPPDPIVTTRDLPSMWRAAAAAAVALVAAVIGAFVGGGRR